MSTEEGNKSCYHLVLSFEASEESYKRAAIRGWAISVYSSQIDKCLKAMDRSSEFRSVRHGSFSIADILNKNPLEPTGNFSVQTRLPEMNSETTTKSEKHIAKAADKLDFEDNSVQGKQRMFADIDADTH